jgi:hypothetical protein
MRSCQYSMPLDSNTNTLDAPQLPIVQPLTIPRPSKEYIPRAPCTLMRWNVHNPHAREAHSYSLFDDLAQYSTTMSVLEVLQTFPSQRKSLLSTLVVVDLSYSCLITFDMDNTEPCFPSLITFHISIKIRNRTVHRCIIDEGSSTYIMYNIV